MKVIVAVCFATLLSACGAVPVSRVNSSEVAVVTFTETNYQLGAPMTAFVGGTLVTAQQFEARVREVQAMRPDRPFVATADNLNNLGWSVVFEPRPVDEPFEILGETTLDGVDVYALAMPFRKKDSQTWQMSHFFCAACLLVTKDGKPTGKALASTYVQAGEVVFDEPDLRFATHRAVKVVSKTPVTGAHELIYAGLSGGQIKLTYREYTRDGLARDAFYQDLAYDVGSTFIRFRNYRLKVVSADSESIHFEVLEDGINDQDRRQGAVSK